MIIDERSAREWFISVLQATPQIMDRLERFAEMLIAENRRQNLISRGSEAHLWSRHFADGAQLLTVPRETHELGPWLDLGTGAGFPGLVVAICRPEMVVHLVDSRRLRTDWLRWASAELGLANAVIHHARVEVLPALLANTISARAFAPLTKLIELSARFSTPDTLWLLPKGARAAQELEELPARWNHVFHVEQSITDPNAGIITGQLLGGPAKAESKG